MMIALALALAASSPAEDALSRQLAPCRAQALHALKGDPGFLNRYLRAAKLGRDAEARQRMLCSAYLTGALDGLEMEKAQIRAEGRRR